VAAQKETAPDASENYGDAEAADTYMDRGSSNATYYWTPNGKSYHSTSGCRSLARSKIIDSGTLSQAQASGHTDPCNNCVR
jgi:competence protein ComEC